MLYIFFIARRYDAIYVSRRRAWNTGEKSEESQDKCSTQYSGKYYETYEPDMHSIVRKKLMIPDKN